ncbi:short-chain dehydrogenase/reductase SDR [Klebsiella michiganensis]|nr:short-chain dehydrogenase/reductase SDR [Klebsiella michiganensis]
MLFVNAGTTNRDPTQTIGEIATEEFIHVMLTNALAPMRVIENLQALGAAAGADWRYVFRTRQFEQ